MANKINNFFTNMLLSLDHRKIITIPDTVYLKLVYRIHMHRELNIKNPKTFNEKLQWLKLHDRKEIYTTMVDKYLVKDYVENLIGKKYIIPTLGVWSQFDAIDFDRLPNQFVLKCTHDSGGLVVCLDKTKFDKQKAKKKIEESLKTNYYRNCREWPYKNVIPRIIVEPYMKDDKLDELIDYKIMCFNGEPKMAFTCTERFNGELKVTFFDLDWNPLPFERHYPSSKKKISKPQHLDTMLCLAKKLSKDIPFVRVDFYEINNKVYFGELTFFPGSGFEEFTPNEYDLKLGEMITLEGSHE